MNKTQLINAIADYTGAPKRSVEAVLEAQAAVITAHLEAADPGIEAEVTLPGIGKIKTVTRAARTGRNPQTGAVLEVPERIAVKLSAGKALVDLLNPA